MALITPQLLSTAAFDATEPHTFRFVVTGGDQVVANRLIIKNNETSEEIYNQQVASFNFEHVLPANTLTNGVYYQATITTYNAAGDASSPSTAIQFYCYSSPTLMFTNMPSGNIVGNSSFAFEATYTQAQGELLNSYTYTLYDAQNVVLATSGVKYVGSTTPPPTVLSYTFTGLSDDASYYIQVSGQTVGGTEVSTERILFSVKYVKPDVSVLINLVDNCQEGYISIQSNFVDIEGKGQPDPPKYVKDNTAVDVRGDGEYVTFDEGYTLTGDFTASLWGDDFNENTEIFQFSNTDGDTITVEYYEDFEDTTKVYAACHVISRGITYYIYTPSIVKPNENDKLQLWLRRIGYLYTLQLHNLGQ